MRQRTTRIALALGLVAGAPALLAAQSTDTLLVLEIPLELRTLSPEVSRVFVECPLVYNAPTGNVDTVAIVRTEEVRPTPTRFGGHLQDRLVTAVTTNDVRGVARGPDYGLQCFLFLVGPDGKGVRPWGFEQVRTDPRYRRGETTAVRSAPGTSMGRSAASM